MIQIKQNTSNDVVLDLTCNSSLYIYSSITPYFLFEFINESTNNIIYFVSDNVAPLSARSRYDEFSIIETGSTSTNYTAGTITISNGNFSKYNVYQQVNQYNLDPLQTNGIVSTGLVFYTPNTSNGYTTFTSNNNNNIFFKNY